MSIMGPQLIEAVKRGGFDVATWTAAQQGANARNFDQTVAAIEKQRELWEKQYAEAHSRWEAHRAQVESFAKADAEAAGGSNETSYSSETGDAPAATDESTAPRPPAPASEGTLASDEALAALREKLTGN